MTAESGSRRKGGKTRILLVDDHPIVRQGIRFLVDHEPDLEVAAEADDAAGAMQAAKASRPQVAVVDLSLNESSGLELIKDLTLRCPDVRVLVLSMRDESLYAERALKAGARGYITKEEGTDRIIEGIREVLKGNIYLSESLASKMIARFVGGRPEPAASAEDRLTDRELEVFELIGRGLTTRQIASALNLSVKTIESHRANIKDKLELDGATDLLKYAIEWLGSRRGIGAE